MNTATRFTSQDAPACTHETSAVFGPEHLPVFKALALCMGGKDRPTLDLVNCENRQDGVFLTATNGHLLLTVELAGQEWMDTVSFTGQSVKDFVSSKGHSPLAIDETYDFPDVRQVIPCFLPPEYGEPNNRLGLNATYVDVMAKVLKALKCTGKSKYQAVTMQHNGPLSPMLFSWDGDDELFVGASFILMPIRLD